MTTLTFRYLGAAVRVGQPLGCDPTGWPYRVESVEYLFADPSDTWPAETRVTVEPWPIPGPLADEMEKLEYAAAMAHARERMAGRLA